jgi:hypothetical protein
VTIFTWLVIFIDAFTSGGTLPEQPGGELQRSIYTQEEWDDLLDEWDQQWRDVDAIILQQKIDEIRELELEIAEINRQRYQLILQELRVQEAYLDWLQWVIDLLERSLDEDGKDGGKEGDEKKK